MTTRISRPNSRLQALEKANPGDIVIFHHARGTSRLITWYSGSSYYHVAIYAGGRKVIESRVKGVGLRDITQAKLRLQFQIIPAPGGPEVGKKALTWALKQVGEQYAYLSVGALLVDRLLEKVFGPMDIVWHENNRISCGELVAEAYQVAGVQLFPGRESDEVAPWDFARLADKKWG